MQNQLQRNLGELNKLISRREKLVRDTSDLRLRAVWHTDRSAKYSAQAEDSDTCIRSMDAEIENHAQRQCGLLKEAVPVKAEPVEIPSLQTKAGGAAVPENVQMFDEIMRLAAAGQPVDPTKVISSTGACLSDMSNEQEVSKQQSGSTPAASRQSSTNSSRRAKLSAEEPGGSRRPISPSSDAPVSKAAFQKSASPGFQRRRHGSTRSDGARGERERRRSRSPSGAPRRRALSQGSVLPAVRLVPVPPCGADKAGSAQQQSCG